MKNCFRLFCVVAGLLVVDGFAAEWTVHEWGTFTSLQDEAGRTIGGINTDDEPVPRFVHRLSNWVLQTPSEVPVIFFQGAPKCHPDITMRLETPVIYFHPPNGTEEGREEIARCDVAVQFRGGWPTEFYPWAQPEIDGRVAGPRFQFGKLTGESTSGLTWKDLKVGGDWALTNTTEHVWTSPRAVEAAQVRTSTGEAEKFLFYRGVAHLDAPLRISRESQELVFRSQFRGPLNEKENASGLDIRASWLVDIRPDGRIAFRSLPRMSLVKDETKILARTKANFAERDFTAANLELLKSALRKTLVGEGLFGDEADALLNTWELSYFKSAGLRVFFIVPPPWTDHYLPLQISLPAKTTRVMVGRIELVTPEKRANLREVATYSMERIDADAKEIGERYYGTVLNRQRAAHEKFAQVSRGEKRLSSAIEVPETYRTYLELGRFRNALILDEASRNPSPALAHFIETYRLQAGSLEQLPQ